MCSLRRNIHDFTRTAIIYIGLLRESSEKNPYRNSDKIAEKRSENNKEIKEIKKISKTPKSLYLIKKNDSKVEKLVCKKLFGKKLSKGKYKIKWIQSKKFTIE